MYFTLTAIPAVASIVLFALGVAARDVWMLQAGAYCGLFAVIAGGAALQFAEDSAM